MDELKGLDCTKIKPFSLSGLVKLAKVVKVYDGDTITVVFKHNNAYNKWTCRLYGIDAPELHSGGIPARDFLSNLVLHQIVSLECFDFEKYGRLLVTVHIDKVDINDLMISTKHAVPYFGGKK
jgi:endonuclease YncB( thermonuclease family)